MKVAEAQADQPKRPRSSPWQTCPQVEALVCELPGASPRGAAAAGP